jgi:hypothetical protein
MAEGNHLISVRSAGFQNWDREMQLNAGSDINIEAKARQELMSDGNNTKRNAKSYLRSNREFYFDDSLNTNWH